MIAFPELPQPAACVTTSATRTYLECPSGRLHLAVSQIAGHIPEAPLSLALTFEPADGGDEQRLYIVLPPAHVYGVGALVSEALGRAVADGVLLSPVDAAKAAAAQAEGEAAAAARAERGETGEVGA